jgi:hypothetical protein
MSAAETAIGVALAMALTVIQVVVEYIVRRRHRKAAAAERFARMAREDAAWEKWLRSASKALSAGTPVPPWRSP